MKMKQQNESPSDAESCSVILTDSECREISDILRRRANELATFKSDYIEVVGKLPNGFPGSVQLAIGREMDRLRGLAEKVYFPDPTRDED
jgi:hypothetical protein